MVEFKEFWSIWPVKKARVMAERAWIKLEPDKLILETIRNDIEMRIQSGEWKLDQHQKKYIPHASTYLNQRRFEDEEYIQGDPDPVTQINTENTDWHPDYRRG